MPPIRRDQSTRVEHRPKSPNRRPVLNQASTAPVGATPDNKHVPKMPTSVPHSAKHPSKNSRHSHRPAGHRPSSAHSNPAPKKDVSPISADTIRIIPLGGVEEIGKNMTAIELGNDIIVVDAGLQFPDENAPGVDYIIPDTTYLETRKDKIRGLVVTHGHLDHIGGIPYVMPKIGNPPIYTSLLTGVMIKKRQEEFVHLPKLTINTVTQTDTVRLGQFKLRFFGATHTIPDTLGLIIETPYGNIIMTGDIKIETKDNIPAPFEVETYTKLGEENNLLLIADSTNVEKEGFSFPEKIVHDNLKKLIQDAPGRIIVSTFASLFDRIVYVIQAAELLGKKVVVEGRSMKTNVEIARELGILKIKDSTIVGAERMDEYPENKLVILATGAQGDEFAALMRISNKTHKYVKLHKGDTVLLSSSVVPGNEKSVGRLKDNLARQGARILHYGVAEIHSSGHSYRGEIEYIHKMIKPKFFVPVHGSHYMLRVHERIAEELGMASANIIVPDNGMIIEIGEKGAKFKSLKESASSRVVMVDGLGTGNVEEVVIRDRQLLSQDGMFVIIATIDIKTGKVRKSPDIISRGFVYLKESQEMLHAVRNLIKKTIEESASKMHPINFDYVKNSVREETARYLFQKTHKRPIILPVLIEV
ncbi:MAG: ribonuclease [Patescibacteria group bacterium]|nr:ribonuclease [Patescibacteria group bacterium]